MECCEHFCRQGLENAFESTSPGCQVEDGSNESGPVRMAESFNRVDWHLMNDLTV